MRKRISALLLPFLLIYSLAPTVLSQQQEAAKSIQLSQPHITPLTNLDVLRMVGADFTPSTIVAQIEASVCEFVTTPEALQQLKAEGVQDAVILAMVMSPKGGANHNHSVKAKAAPKIVSVKVPSGLMLEVEAPFTIDSQNVKEGDAISFRVVNPVKINGVVVFAAGATATARVSKASRGGHFGRAGRLAWTMRDVTAVDGTRVQLQNGGRIVGDSKGAKVATAMVITGALLWAVAPVALLHGFKRGENAILPAGKRLEVSISAEATVNGTVPE